MEAVVFDTGRLKLKAHADFLADPHVALNGDFQVEKVALDYFRPITERYNLSVRRAPLMQKDLLNMHPTMKKSSSKK